MKSKEILSEKDREVMKIRIEQKHAWQHPLFPASEINRILVALEAAESEIEELRKQIDSEKPSYEAGSNLGTLIRQHTDDILKERKI